MIRIFLNEAVHREVSAMIGADYESYGFEVPADWILLQEMTARNAQRIASDICASVPQFTKLSAGEPLAVASAAFLLWPLSAAGESYLSPEPLRLYAIDRLKFLGREARLPQALWAAQMLEESEKPVIVNVSSGMGSMTLTNDPDRVESSFTALAYPSSKSAVTMARR